MIPQSRWSTRGLAVCALALAVALSACGGQTGDPEMGRQLYQQQTIGASGAPGCVTCHSLDADRVVVGPSHAGVATRASAVVRSEAYHGSASTPAEYLRESILEPDAYVVAGFDASLMYQSYGEVLSEDQIANLVAFLQTLE